MINTYKLVCGWTVFLVATAFLISRVPTNIATAQNITPDPQISNLATSTVATTTPKRSVWQKNKKLYIEVKVPSNLTPYTTRVLSQLLNCESGYNAIALNAVDRDNTPSFGALQFKPSTWFGVLQKYYDPYITPEQSFLKIFDGDLQVKMFVRWFEDGTKGQDWWDSQFPDCAKKHNYWK